MAAQLGDLPKALAPVQGEPFLDHLLRLAAAQGVDEVVLCLGHGHQAIQAYLAEHRTHFGVRVRCSVEPVPLGTAGAVKLALPLVQGTFLALNGDTWLAADWRALLAAHRAGDTLGTIGVVAVPDTGRFGRVRLAADGRVTAFAEKAATGAGYVNSGLYALEPAALDGVAPGQPASFEHDVFPALAARGLLRAQVLPGAHLDIGTPAALEQARAGLA